jgi:hypothetical protein
MWADNSEAIASELSRARWTDEKSHIAPCLGQPATKVTTHRTGADDKDPHSGRHEVLVESCLFVTATFRAAVLKYAQSCVGSLSRTGQFEILPSRHSRAIRRRILFGRNDNSDRNHLLFDRFAVRLRFQRTYRIESILALTG